MRRAFPVEIRRKDYNDSDFSVTATTNYSCNYNCKYCYNETHDTHKLLNLSNLSKFICKIAAIGYKVDLFLIGGEPTLHPELVSFSKEFSSKHIGGMSIFTNLAASFDMYKQLMEDGTTIIATYHKFKDNEDLFIQKALKLNEYASSLLKVNVMLEKSSIGSSVKVYDSLKSIKQLELCIEHKEQYSLEELQIFNDRHKDESSDDSYIVTYSDGSKKELLYNDLADSEEFNVKNWICEAGRKSFYIHVSGDIYKCESHFFDKRCCIGNIACINNIQPLLKKTVCPCNDCYNFHIFKHRIFSLSK